MYPLIDEYRDVYAQYLISFKSTILSNDRFQAYLNELYYAGEDRVVSVSTLRDQLTTFSSYASQKLSVVNQALQSEGYGI